MKIMVSACLLPCAVREELADAVRARHLAGENCKYNGGNNRNEKVLRLMEGNKVITVCPEEMGGLPTPRVPSEICNGIVTAKDGRIVDKEYRGSDCAAVQKSELRRETAV